MCGRCASRGSLSMMIDTDSTTSQVLGLRVGDWVEVRSADEILATLDDRGRLDQLPFMPEMLEYCGRKFRVFKSAHKTCDTIEIYKARRMTGAVHLEGLRCDGKAHGGCQAGCLLFWKEAWLKPVRDPGAQENRMARPAGTQPPGENATPPRCDIDTLARVARVPGDDAEGAGDRYSCQATELLKATTPLRWWDPGQYLKDVRSGNVRLGVLIRHVLLAAYNSVMRLHWRARMYPQYPSVRGLAGEKTPKAVLDLQPGELVEVRSKDEIMRTISARQRNRGLWFDVEMLQFCGKTCRVLRRVERIINEKTGKMTNLPNDCIILDDVVCSGCYSKDRLFCPRSIYPYWREIWLKRVG
jgi:hypothetical protein